MAIASSLVFSTQLHHLGISFRKKCGLIARLGMTRNNPTNTPASELSARQTTRGKRSRVFEAPEALAVFNMVERRLASPMFDTANAAPARPVPKRYENCPSRR